MRTIHFQQALLATGWEDNVRIGVKDGVIAAITMGEPPQPGDARHAIGVPGMPNVHSHAFQRGMAGLAERRGPGGDSFWTWREAMYRFVDRMTPEHLLAIAALAFVEMLETGFTRVGEFHYLHHDPDGAAYADPAELSHALVAAAAETGLGLTLLPVFYAHATFGGTEPRAAQRRFVTDLDQFARLLEAVRGAAAALPDAVVGLAPHSLRAVTADELRGLEILGQTGPIHIHIAEQRQEVDDCLAWSGRRPVEWLIDHAEVDRDWCLVHATHVNPAECLAIARSGAVVGLCPVTEANLGDGLFPAGSFLASGGRLGVGSDSNVLIDMTEELRWLEYGQRLNTRSRNVLASGPGRSTGQDVYQAALRSGGQALGAAVGFMAGGAADMIALDADHPSLAGRKGAALVDGFLFAAGRQAITSVWRRGEEVVRGGRHVARDRIAARYLASVAALADP